MSHDTKSEVAADAPILLDLATTATAAPGGPGAAPEAATDAAPAVTPEPAATAPGAAEKVTRETGRAVLEGAARIAIDRIRPDPNQPRTVLERSNGRDADQADRLQALADDMLRHGQLTPVQVRWSQERGCYLLVSGHRRWEAAKLAGLTTLDCVVVDGLEDSTDRLEVQLSENRYRKSLSPIELARSYNSLLHARSWSTYDLGRVLHVSPSSVTRLTALLTLPDRVQELINEGRVGSDKGYELSKLVDPQEQTRLAEQIASRTLSREELRERTQEPRTRKPSPHRPWTFELDGVVRITVRPLGPEITDDDVIKALEAALEDRRPARKAATSTKPRGKRLKGKNKPKAAAQRETEHAGA